MTRPAADFLRTLDPLDWSAPPTSGCAVSVVIPARRGAHLLGATVHTLAAVLEAEFGASYEFIVVVNGSDADVAGSLRAARDLAASSPNVRLEVPPTLAGKGAAAPPELI